MKDRISNRFRGIIISLRSFLFLLPDFKQNKVIAKSHLHQLSLRLDLHSVSSDESWKNGWYVNGGGNDDRKLSDYNPENVQYLKDSIKLVLSQNQLQGSKFPYSGVMKYSMESFREGIFGVTVMIDLEKNAKFAFWLKSFNEDINEIDVVEIFNKRMIKTFFGSWTKAVFTLHTGKDYETDHRMCPTSCWIPKGYMNFSLEKINGLLVWRVNGLKVKVEKDPDRKVTYGAIIDYEANGEVKHTAETYLKDLFAYSK